MNVEMNDIIALILKSDQKDNEYDFVNPTTKLEDCKTEQELNNSKTYILKNLNIDGYDISSLVDTFIELNKKSVTLTVKSNPEDGYIIDYDGKFSKYLCKDGDGWEKLQEENPKAQCWITISQPAYDPESNIVLVYLEKIFYDQLFGGDVIAYYYALKYEDGRLILLNDVLTLMS